MQVSFILKLMPLIFAVGFLTPVLAQIFYTTSAPMPFGLSPLMAALLFSLTYGLVAQIRGRWI